MSMNNLLTAVITSLRTRFSLTEHTCDESADGQPKPYSGQEAISVVSGDISNSSDTSLDEYYSLTVVVTRRHGVYPVAKQATPLQAIRDRAEEIRTFLHINYAVIIAANVLIGAENNGFVEPLVFQSMAAPQTKGPDWFWAEGSQNAPTGLAMVLTFGKARRVQVIEEQDD